jgi:hypothetical protein
MGFAKRFVPGKSWVSGRRAACERDSCRPLVHVLALRIATRCCSALFSRLWEPASIIKVAQTKRDREVQGLAPAAPSARRSRGAGACSMTTPQVQNSSAYDCETPQAMQRSNTDMSIGGIYPDGMPAAVTPMERINTDMSVPGAPGDIQNTAEDVIGGQSAVFSDGNPYPVLGFGFCASRGRRPYNEDRLLLSPRVNGSHSMFPCPLFTCSTGALRAARAGGRAPRL